jgi:DNA polymerase-1
MFRLLKRFSSSSSSLLAEANLKASQRLNGITVVDSLKSASRALQVLHSLPRHTIHACDTEVANINVKKQSPIGHGNVICFSVYCGPNVDFGSGPILWVDTYQQSEGGDNVKGEQLLQVFKGYFENDEIKKVWHHYGFDKHVLSNHGIECKGFAADTLHMARVYDSARKSYSLQSLCEDLLVDGKKRTMTERFGRMNRKKDGTEGKLMVTPDVLSLHTDLQFREEWIEYSADDAKLTWELYQKLEELLKEMEWYAGTTMNDFYSQYYRKFGEILTEMERHGFYINKDALQKMETQAFEDLKTLEKEFIEWAAEKCPDAKYMNISSDPQKQQLLFAPSSDDPKMMKKTGLEHERKFETENTEGFIEPGKKQAKKKKSFILKGLGIPSTVKSEKGKPSVNSKALRNLCGYPRSSKNKSFGTIYDFFGGGNEGEKACLAIDSLLQHGSILTLLETFILPLQGHVDSSGRIHCSLNIGTETGRLSSRSPNLQNQPALEKDLYKIRNAFAAAPGNLLIVCDYSQLELRVLAHISQCKAMIDAFQSGGDLHSRTAVSMFPYIAEDVKAGKVLVEEGAENPTGKDLPLVKDIYAAERRKAKMLNFSIAYGKTSRGLAEDWKVSHEEAIELLERWYGDRPEVKRWQQEMIKLARQTGSTRTIMGRYRNLPDINSDNIGLKKHSERCAINTPIQGSAADIVMKAMLKIKETDRIRQLGWNMVLQIHDELIIEGPKETAEEAFALVKDCMTRPFKNPFLVDLEVSGQIAETWYEAK